MSIERLTEDLKKLVHKFEAERYHYLSKNYSEAQARIDFILNIGDHRLAISQDSLACPGIPQGGLDAKDQLASELSYHGSAVSRLKADSGSLTA